MQSPKTLALTMVFFACVGAGRGGAATASPSPAPPAAVPDAITHHTIALGGKTLAYTARAGTIVLRNDDEAATGSMFYVAYTLDGVAPARRPVTFFYNGGPGSSTMWLHMGSFAPVRVVTANGETTGPPPYRVVANDDSLLDRSDLVFIDMPDTGFGRIFGAGKPKDFFGVDADVAAFAQFVTRYITTFGRWNSPKFLYGESYGTTRSAALVDDLQKAGIGINGVVLQSSILNFGLDRSRNGDIGGNDNAFIFYLPSEAATAWYHKALPNPPADLGALLPEVQQFALGEYADALARGARLPRSTYDDVVAKLHAYTGLSATFIRNSNLRVPYPRFEAELLRERGQVVGRLDSRFSMQMLDRLSERPDSDPTEAAISDAFTAAVNQYLRADLHYQTPLLYRPTAYAAIRAAGGWDSKHRGNVVTDVSPDLAEAMAYDPHLRVFSANGYYDFATPYFATTFTLDHLGLSPSLRGNITYGFYQTGHMIYLVPSALNQLHADLERWYAGALGGS
jgi:carboxypeptidase C (cathepsin A)